MSELNFSKGPFCNTAPLCLASASPRRELFLRNLGLDFFVQTSPEPEPLPCEGEEPAAFAARSARAKGLAVAEAVGGGMRERFAAWAGRCAGTGTAACEEANRKPAGSAVIETGTAASESGASGIYFAPGARPALIAADTVVAVDGRILGKPRNPEHGLEMLRLLAGRWHTVVSACFVLIYNMYANGLDGPARTGGLCSGCRPPVSLFTELHTHEETGVRFWDVPEAALASYAFSGEPADKAGGYAVTGAGAFMVEAVEGSINNVVGLPLTALTHLLLQEKIIEAAAFSPDTTTEQP